MRAVLQRVTSAGVTVDGKRVAEIGPGLMILLGVGQADAEQTCRVLASKVARLRIFEDDQGKMNRSLLDTGGSALVVSQFTLYGDTRKGLRPSFTLACEPKRAEELYLRFASELGYLGVPVKTGKFAARMDVDLVNNGPVTILLDSEENG
ncbi:MAG: D-tyrosyl-tRNA(Tyr) deacylase [candidate division WOR-3 bacterium]|nr:MAG: D-tyrosyl-tRNA(Tyr) deacylase [candidate division WOR-3 bacterium]